MSLTPLQTSEVDDLRRRFPEFGDRKIADQLGTTHWQIRQDRLNRLEAITIAPPPETGPKVLIYDIETSFKVGAYWGKEWQTNIAKMLADWQLISIAYKWEGDDETHFVGTWEDKNWHPSFIDEQDEYVAKHLYLLHDAADVVIAHNGDGFDQKKANARFLRHEMTPPSHYIEVDTLKISRAFFGLTSHRLDALAEFLKLEGKVSHEGIDLWVKVLNGDLDAQDKMRVYNLRDVDLLLEVYKRLEPWIGFNGRGRKFNRALWAESGAIVCPNCGSYDLSPNGNRPTAVKMYQSYLCNDCGARPSERTFGKNKKGVVLK